MNQHVPPVTPVLDQGSLIQPVTGLELLEDMLRKFLFPHEGVPRQQAYQENVTVSSTSRTRSPCPRRFRIILVKARPPSHVPGRRPG